MTGRIVKNLTGEQIHPYLDETEVSLKKMVFWTKPV